MDFIKDDYEPNYKVCKIQLWYQGKYRYIEFPIARCPHCEKLETVWAYNEDYAGRIACNSCGYSKWVRYSTDDSVYEDFKNLVKRWNNEGFLHW